VTADERAESAYALTMVITGSPENARRVRNLVQQEIAQAIAEEREACAQIVEKDYVGNRVETDVGDVVRAKAAAIRARK
jgi:hypothetical protein